MPTPVLTSTASSNVFGFDPNLKLPYVYQWNSTIEQQVGSAQVLSVGYVGSAGKRLLISRQFFPGRLNNPNFPVGSAYLYATMNGASSNYHALQTQFRRHYAQGLQLLTSYTWSHAIDDASSNFTLNSQQRASANFDIRHNLQAAVSWDLPGRYEDSRVARMLFRGWGRFPCVFAIGNARRRNCFEPNHLRWRAVRATSESCSRPAVVYQC